MTQKMIMQVLPSLKQGGVERGTIEIAEALQQAKMPNCVVSAGGKMVAELQRIGVEHITLPVQSKNPITMWLNSYRLQKLFKEKNIGLVHVRSRAPAWSVKWACKRTGVPFITTYHGVYGTKPEWFKKWYNRVMLSGRYVIAVSAYVKNHIMKEYCYPEQKIRLIYRGADVTKFDPKKVTKAQISELVKTYQIPTDKPIITLVGRFTRIKGHSVLLDAIPLMTHKEVTLLFIGGNPKGNFEQELKEKIAALPEQTEVKMFHLTGDKMPIAYALTDIYVQPTLVPESFGRSVAEAQAMGRIVVAANHGGVTELILNGKTGFLVPVGDSKVLAHMLDNIIEMPAAEKKKIEKQAMESVHNVFSIQKMCEQTLKVYKEILNEEAVQ